MIGSKKPLNKRGTGITKKQKIVGFMFCSIFIAGIYLMYLGNGHPGNGETPLSKSYLSNYIIDNNHQILLKDTSLVEKQENSEDQLKEYIAIRLVNRGTAEYFRFLQTHFNQGGSLQENTELIHQHLITTLPRDKGEELFELYKKFVNFEFEIAEETKDWEMPESADETLELIEKMQRVQQQYFGEEVADQLFGGDLKGMEYNARRAGILNDRITSGIEKEAMLKQLDRDMFGEEAETLDEKKNPYNLFEEKLFVYKNDLDEMTPSEKEEKIKELRELYLPPQANQATAN